MNDNHFFAPKRILCPVDFSDLSSLALKYAAVAATEFNAGLTVIHAELFEVPRYLSRNQDKQLIRELKNAESTIRKDLQLHTEKIVGAAAGKLLIEYAAVDRHPVEAILDLAGKEAFGLIVMGTHGYGGLKQFFLGSVTENVIRGAQIPVFTIRQKTHDFIDIYQTGAVPDIKHILCPCYPADAAVPSLKTAVSIAERYKARLTVLFCVEETKNKDSGDREKEGFGLWIAKTINSTYPINQIVCEGNAAEKIISTAHKEKCDMIVIGANHQPFMGSSFLGRTTELVLRQAPVPVMAVPHFKK